MAVHLGFDDSEHSSRFEDLGDTLEFLAPGGSQQVDLEFRGEHHEPGLSKRCGSGAGGVIGHGGLNPRVDETVLLKMTWQDVDRRDTGAVASGDRLNPELRDERRGTEDPFEFV